MMAVSAVVCVVTAPDDGSDPNFFSAAQAQDNLDVVVHSLRPPRTDQHEVQANRREFDTPIRRNPNLPNRLHRAHAVLDDRPVKLDSLVVGTLGTDDDLIGRAAINDRHIGDVQRQPGRRPRHPGILGLQGFSGRCRRHSDKRSTDEHTDYGEAAEFEPTFNHCPFPEARAFSRWWNRSARNWAVAAGSNGGLILATKRPCGSITATAALCVTW